MLSVHVFHRPESELKQQISSLEFERYVQFFLHEPFPDPWLIMGHSAASNAMCHGAKRVLASDFKPKIRRQQTVSEMKSALWANIAGRVKRG